MPEHDHGNCDPSEGIPVYSDSSSVETEQTENLDFGRALSFLRRGRKVARAGWNGKGMWILLQSPDEHSKMTLPYLYIEYPEGHPAYPSGSRVPWLASQTDILAFDWFVVE